MCELCGKLSMIINKNYSDDVELGFDGYFRIAIKLESDSFYLISEWLGCPNFKDSPCVNKNGSNIKIKINCCPKCGGKLSIYRLSRLNVQRS